MISVSKQGHDMDSAASPHTEAVSNAGRNANFVMRRTRTLLAGLGLEMRHARHVTRLALSLFDQLGEFHGLGHRERLLLECAGLLHDAGWVKGRRGHHKESMRMIQAASDLGLTRLEQSLVANVARYHRKALPSKRHPHYRRLADEDRAVVSMLGALLRLADGLDRTHRSVVRSVEIRQTILRLKVTIYASGDVSIERGAARQKSNLLEQVLRRKARFQWVREKPLAAAEPHHF